jgi:hypothetical protein
MRISLLLSRPAGLPTVRSGARSEYLNLDILLRAYLGVILTRYLFILPDHTLIQKHEVAVPAAVIIPRDSLTNNSFTSYSARVCRQHLR